MHRISVFRDDVIFVIYLCQRRMYPVDKARPAEGYEIDTETEVPLAAAADGGSSGAAAAEEVAEEEDE